MNKFTICLMTLLAVLLSYALEGCKDEPEVDFDIQTVRGDRNPSSIPFGYTELTVKYVCSDAYLDVFSPVFFIQGEDKQEMIETTRGDFKLSEEKIPVSLKVDNGDNTEIVNCEVTYYEYSFNGRIEKTDKVVGIFALSRPNDDVEGKIAEWLLGTDEEHPLFRGFIGLEMNSYCPDGMKIGLSDVRTFGEVNGYLIKKSIDDIIKALMELCNYYPSMLIINRFPDFMVDCVELSLDDLEGAATTSHGSVQTNDAIGKLRDKSDLVQKSIFEEFVVPSN